MFIHPSVNELDFINDFQSLETTNSVGKPIIYLVNTNEYPLEMDGNGTHVFMMRKLTRSFQLLGFYVKEISSFESIVDSTNNIFIICHPSNGLWGGRIKQANISFLSQVYPKSFFLLFAFHSENYENLPIKNYILTDIKLTNFTDCPKAIESYQSSSKFIPIDMGTFLFPNEISIIEKHRFDVEREYDVLYIGNSYKPDHIIEVAKHFTNFIHIYEPYSRNYIFGRNRIEKFLNSNFSFCFQGHGGVGSIQNGVITERVFESMSMGLVCVTDHEYVSNYTNGIVTYVENANETISFIKKMKNNKHLFQEKIEQGFSFCKEKRNYSIVCNNLLSSLQKIGYQP